MKTKWVLACGARRSGSTLQYHLARDIVESAGGLNRGWTTWQMFDEVFNKLDGKHKHILIKCHVHMPSKVPACGKLWDEGRGYGVFIHRNMYDTMASALRLNSANIESPPPNLIEQDLVAIVKEINEWLSTDNVLVSRYADILSRDGKAAECARIAEHIGVRITDRECDEIASRYSINKQKERLAPKGGDQVDNLWPDHISTGEIGLWRNELTPSQIKFCTHVSKNLHKRLGYNINLK